MQTLSWFIPLLIILTSTSTTITVATHISRSHEAQALLTFKDAITYDYYSCLSSWSLDNSTATNDVHCFSWYGIHCDTHFHVISLGLTNCFLSGSISPSLHLLTRLSHLDLSDNEFSGHIPPSLGLLTLLSYLNISHNELSGILSLSLFPHPNSSLTYLDLSYNYHLSGEIPPPLPLNSPNLRFLDITYTNLSGTVPPALWTHPPHLRSLSIGWDADEYDDIVNLQQPAFVIPLGTFPSKLAFCATIEVLILSGLNASGASFPSSLGDCLQLQRLKLDIWGLYGSIPSSIWQLPNLQHLSIRDANRVVDSIFSERDVSPIGYTEAGSAMYGEVGPATISGPYHLKWSMPSSFGFCSTPAASSIQYIYIVGIGLTGPIPASIATCAASLQHLIIVDSSLQGPLPSTLGNLTQLQYLSFISNHLLSGEIPGTLGALTNLTNLVLSQNNLLTRNIPDALEAWQANLLHLELSQNSLTGGIPPVLGSLKNLKYLDLSQNNLAGTIPDTVGALADLKILILSQNRLTGAIPPALGSSMNLEYLDLSQNKLTGRIPTSLGALKNLMNLYLSNNSLTETIPPALGSLTRLTELDLSDNSLTGILPINHLLNLTELSTLGLSQNHLTGKIESLDLSKLPYLQVFDAYGNNFDGGLPLGLSEHEWLVFIDLQRNQLSGSLGDTTTAKITGLSSLQVLSVSYNQLNGDIPAWVWQLPSLQLLDLSNNHFTGHLPPSLTNLSFFCMTNQTADENHLIEELPIVIKNNKLVLSYVLNTRILFDVSMNMLGGEIPKSFGELQGLTGVNLSHNHFNGTIPEGSFGRLKNLDVLDLSYNQLTGEIPQDLATFDISIINLSNNQLKGPIPTQNGFNTRNNRFAFANNPGLCGSPLPQPCNTGNVNGTTSTRIKQQRQRFSVRIWLDEFVSPWAFLIAYISSIPIGTFIFYPLLKI